MNSKGLNSRGNLNNSPNKLINNTLRVYKTTAWPSAFKLGNRFGRGQGKALQSNLPNATTQNAKIQRLLTGKKLLEHLFTFEIRSRDICYLIKNLSQVICNFKDICPVPRIH